VLVECSSGTYIRSLAADLGAALGGPAHLAELRRLRVGSFTIEEAQPLDAIEADRESTLVSPVEAMRALERATVDAESARAVAHGSVFSCAPFAVTGPGPYAVVDEHGVLLAVYERRGAGLKPSVVLPPADTGGS
jgi:tRNA pseudouridine55 synthase